MTSYNVFNDRSQISGLGECLDLVSLCAQQRWTHVDESVYAVANTIQTMWRCLSSSARTKLMFQLIEIETADHGKIAIETCNRMCFAACNSRLLGGCADKLNGKTKLLDNSTLCLVPEERDNRRISNT